MGELRDKIADTINEDGKYTYREAYILAGKILEVLEEHNKFWY